MCSRPGSGFKDRQVMDHVGGSPPWPGFRATWPTERWPRQHSSTISALNSGVDEQRGDGFFFPILSLADIRPGAQFLITDVRRRGSSPGQSPHV